jgi:hypothetical protein
MTGYSFNLLVEKILFEDQIQDFAKKHAYSEEAVQQVREICGRIGPRALAKYGIWLLENAVLQPSYDAEKTYQVLEKFNRVSASPAFTGSKNIMDYSGFR